MFVQKFKKVFEFVYFSIVIILAAGAYIACDIGLGGAVDTEPPTGGISSPGDNAVIRDSFAIKGSWKDDGAVGKVTVALRNTSTNSTNTYNATVAPDGTWLCAVNPADSSQPLADGNYVATVTLYDNGGHTGKLTRSYTVDNTPPVVILQRPSTIITDSDTDTYGQKFTLQGQAADDNNINKIDVNVYSDSSCTNFLKTISLNNVPASINLDVATFSESIDNDYSVIYGHTTKSGSEIRYCKILAYDGAQRYPADGSNQTAADTYGNVQTEYYLYDEISSTVLSNYKVNEIYSIYNGTYPVIDSSRALAVSNENMEAVKAALAGKAKSTGKFALNPANNPIFTVSGKNQLKKDGKDFTDSEDYFISTGNEVMVEVSTGLDGITLEEASLRVYFLECDNNGKSINDIKYYPVTEKTKSGTGYKFKTPVASGLKSADLTKELILGHTYIFGVEGQDTSGNTVEANGNGYGFYLAASGAAPNLNVTFSTSPDGANWTEQTDSLLYLKKDTWVKIEGSVTVEQGRPDFSIKLDKSDNKTTQDWLGDEKRENPFTYTFEKIYEPSDFGSVSKQHDLVVTATQSRRTTEKAYTILYDLEGPVITLSDISPVAAKYTDELGTSDGKKYLNGNNVSIRFAISDAYDVVDSTNNKAFIQILDKESGAVKLPANGEEPVYITTPANFTWADIDTRKIASGDESKEIIIRVTAYDRAGNKTVTDFSDYFVDQTTDKPVVLPNTPSMLSFGISAPDEISEKNKYSSGTQLLIKLMDDDGLAGITTYCIKENDNFVISEKTDSVTGINATYTYNLPTGVGYYYYRFRVTDIKGNESFVPSESGKFIIRITAGAPTLQDVKAYVKDGDEIITTTEYTKGSQSDDSRYFENKIVFDSEYSYFIIYRSTSETGTYEPVSGDSPVQLTKENGSFVYRDSKKDKTSANKTLRPAETTTFYYKVAGVDIADTSENNKYSSNIKSVTCKVDKSAPKVKITRPSSNTENKDENAISEASFQFEGEIDEDNSMSGVYYAIVQKDGTEPTPPASNELYDNVWISAGFTKVDSFGTTAWKTKQEFVEGKTASAGKIPEGQNYKITVYAVDKAGNVGHTDASAAPIAAEMTFDVDMNSPVLESVKVLNSDESESYVYNINKLDSDKKGSFKVAGKASDTLELASVTINAKSSDNEKTFTVSAASDGSWVYEFKFGTGNLTEANYLKDGVYTFKITAKDSVGKEKSVEKTVTIDTVKPVILDNDEYPVKLGDIKYSSTKWYDSKTLPLEVTVSDGASGSKIKRVQTSTDTVNWKIISLVDGTTDTYMGNIQLSNLSNEGKQTFYIKATDNADNDSDVKACEVQVDITAPELEYTKYKIGDDFSTETFINGEKSLTVYGTYADVQSGVQALTFTGTVENGTDTNGKKKYRQPAVKYSAYSQNPESIADDDWKDFDDPSLSGVKTLSWRAVFENNIISENGEIHVTGKNKAGEGLETDKKLFKLNKDTNKPELTNIKITPSLSEYSVYEKTEATGSVYYLNNTKGTFTFSGMAEDKEKTKTENNVTTKLEEASGVHTVSLSIDGLTTQPSDQPSAYFNGIDLSGITGEGTVATITVTDNAGNEFEKQLTIKFDTAAPVGKHEYDKKGQDIYFRVGDKNNDVGGKYSPDTYGKLNTLKIRGKFEDALTEAAAFYYKVFDHTPDTADLEAIKTNYENKMYSYFNGNFAPLGTPEVKSVTYTDNSGNQKTDDIVSNFKTTIADLNEGSNYLVILAVDKVGNADYETITDKDGNTYYSYRINVDQSQPVIKTDENETKYTNAEADWTLSGTYEDGISWLAEDGISLTLGSTWSFSGTPIKLTDIIITDNKFTSDVLKDTKYDYLTNEKHARIKIIKPDNTSAYYEVKNTDSPKESGEIEFSPAIANGTYSIELGNGTWSTTIKKETLKTFAGQTKTISAVAKDNAEMSVTEPVFATVIVDREYPKVEIGSLATIINKKVSLTVTASDNTGLKSISFLYKKHSDTEWNTYQTVEASANSKLENPYSWTLELNTEDAVFTDETEYDFCAIATDFADNTGNSGVARTDADNSMLDSRTKRATISQDSDRPVIKFENWTFQPYEEDSIQKFPLGRTEITFTVDDDDGVEENNVFYQFTALTKDSVTTDDSNWKSKSSINSKLTYDSVNHKYKISNIDEGEQKIWFKIVDKKNETFISSSATNKPKLQDSNNSSEYDSALALRVDSMPPRVDDVRYLRLTGSNPSDYTSGDWVEKNAISAEKFGGAASKNKNKFRISLYAFDENPIRSVTLTIPQVTGDSTGAVYEYSLTNDFENKSTYGLNKSNSASYSLWMTEDIDVSKFKTSKRTCTVTVTEGVNPNSDTTFDLIIDNSGPHLEGAVSPESTEPIVGSFKIRGALVDKEGDINGVGVNADEVKYYIPKSSETDASSIAYTAWKETDSGSLTLTIQLSELNTVIGYSSDTETVSDDYLSYGANLDGLYQIPVWLRLEDNYGNITYDTSSISIRYNPNADKPVVSITDPVHDTPTAAPTYVIAGGKLKISGTASDDVGIKAVYLQFDMDGDGVYENGEGVSGAPSLTLENIPNKKEGDVQLQGVKASGTESWSYSVNILDLTDLSEGQYLKVRAIAVDKGHATEDQDLCSAWTDVLNVHVDNIKPQFSVPELRCYSAAIAKDTAAQNVDNYICRKDYSNSMYIREKDLNWYIYGEALVKQDNYITELDVTGAATGVWAGANGSGTSSGDVISWSSDSGKTHKFLIPVKQNNQKTVWETTITAKGKNINDNKNENEYEYQINIDNKLPEFSDKNDGSEESAKGSIKLYKNTYGGNVLLPDSTGNKTLCNDNANFVTIAGKITEKESGFDKLVFYLERGTNYYLINTKNFSSNIASADLTVTDSLPVHSITSGITRESEYTFKVASSSVKSFVRVGGLVKIGGDYRRITKIETSGTDKVFTIDSACPLKFNDKVEFVFAMVLDSNNETLNTANTTIDETDGDELYEKYKPDGNDYIWEIAVNSKNIPDGPVTIRCAVIDKAGNISTGYTNTYISNKPPRLTSVILGTDTNADGKYTFTESDTTSEFKQYFVKDTESENQTDVWNLSAKIKSGTTEKYWTAKKNLVVIPEFVGGNGEIYYKYSKETGSSGAKLTSAEKGVYTDDASTTLGKLLTAAADIVFPSGKTLVDLKSESDNSNGVIILTNNLSDSAVEDTLGEITRTGDYEKGSSDGVNVYRFSFWDSTDACTIGDNSQWCVLNITMAQDLYDGTAPTGSITPFYWKGTGRNNSSVYYEGSTAKGHIEIESDWKLSSGYKSTDTDGEYDGDPKVSGKIKIEGTAYDETMLKTITVTFDNQSVTATYNPAATSAEEKWTYATNTDDFALAVTDTDGPTQDGHSVTWTYTVDTSKASSVAKTDVAITVLVRDASEANNNAGNPSTTGTYRVDVLPYITQVYTKLAKNKVTNWSVYNRTALGHYPVQSVVSNIDGITLKTTTSEDVVLHGYNLNVNTATIVSGDNTFTVGNETDELLKIDNSTEGQLSFNVAKLKSGKLNLTVNGLAALNNINYNNAKGNADDEGTNYANCYNRQPNGDTNNILTDDIEFDVWEFNDRAAVPINGLAAGINMEVNQVTGMLNYAFANGGLYFSMGGNTDNTTAYSATKSYSSYYWAGDWDTFAGPCVGFHVDELGYTYSVVSGGDTNNSGSVDKWVLYTSRWGLGPHNSGGTLDDSSNDSGSFNAIRLEEIALRTGSDKLNYSMMKYRFLSPEFASTVSGTSTNLYLVYYDALCNQIRFRAGTFNGTTKQSTGGFTDQYTGGASSYYKTNNCQIIANGSQGATFKTDENKTKTVTGISGRGSGQYVDVAVVKDGTDDVVCVVWYDVGANNMKYSYITNPIGQWNSLKGNETAAKWSTPQTIFTEGGEYCHIVADKNNHLHIAAYAGNGDVMYAYLDTYSSDAITATVDSSGSVGEHLTLDVAVNSNNHSIPYIGYYTGAIKKPKYAYLVDPTVYDSTATFTQVAAGSDDYERFTGNWEITVVPTPSSMTTNREDKVNCGVWKSAGVLTDSKVGNAVKNSSTGGTFNGYSSTNWSKTFGNGTSNGVLGYQIASETGTCLETAQMR